MDSSDTVDILAVPASQPSIRLSLNKDSRIGDLKNKKLSKTKKLLKQLREKFGLKGQTLKLIFCNTKTYSINEDSTVEEFVNSGGLVLLKIDTNKRHGEESNQVVSVADLKFILQTIESKTKEGQKSELGDAIDGQEDIGIQRKLEKAGTEQVQKEPEQLVEMEANTELSKGLLILGYLKNLLGCSQDSDIEWSIVLEEGEWNESVLRYLDARNSSIEQLCFVPNLIARLSIPKTAVDGYQKSIIDASLKRRLDAIYSNFFDENGQLIILDTN